MHPVSFLLTASFRLYHTVCGHLCHHQMFTLLLCSVSALMEVELNSILLLVCSFVNTTVLLYAV